MKSFESKRRKKSGTQPGNFNGDSLRKFTELAVRKSGMITEQQLTTELEGVMSHNGLTVEIAMLRYVMLKLMQLTMTSENAVDYLQYARGISYIGNHLAQMLMTEKQLDQRHNEMSLELIQAIDEVMAETEEQRKIRFPDRSGDNFTS